MATLQFSVNPSQFVQPTLVAETPLQVPPVHRLRGISTSGPTLAERNAAMLAKLARRAAVASIPSAIEQPVIHRSRIAPPTPDAIVTAMEPAELSLTAQQYTPTSPKASFSDAATLWFEAKKRHLKSRTRVGVLQQIRQLNKFFGPQRLYRIHIGHVRAYQEARTHNLGGMWKHPCGPSIVNHEIVTLMQIMREAREWEKIGVHYEPLPVPSFRPPKVMSDEEEIRLFAVAETSLDLEIARRVATITLHTGASGTELRHLRYSDVRLDADKPWFRVDAETAKNEFRGRVVMMNQTAQKTMRKIMERGVKLGGGRPDHFIFPGMDKDSRSWNFCKPPSPSWLRHSFPELARRAGLPWLTPHCLRHQHITISIEAGEPIEQIMLRVGHVSSEMTRWYLSFRADSQQRAVNALDASVRFGKHVA
jgi:integrase